jgi:hypothetical protein
MRLQRRVTAAAGAHLSIPRRTHRARPQPTRFRALDLAPEPIADGSQSFHEPALSNTTSTTIDYTTDDGNER